MAYSNPLVIDAMYQSTNRATPMQAARAKQQQNIENQFAQRRANVQQQQADASSTQADTGRQELMRRMAKDISEMNAGKRDQMRQEIEDKGAEAMYAQQQGPEAWDRLMQKRKMNVPFEQADTVIAPAMGMGKLFEAHHKHEKMKADQELEAKKLNQEKDKRTTFQRNLAELTKDDFMSKSEAVSFLNTQKGKSDDQVEQELMQTLMRSDEGKYMTAEEAREFIKGRMLALKQNREEREADDPNDPLGLGRQGGFTGGAIHTQ